MQADRKSLGFSLESFVPRYPLLFDSRSVGEVTNKRLETECTHPMVHEGKCSQCNKSMGDGYGIPVGYLQCSLRRISAVQAEQIRHTKTRYMMNMKKLHLVLDLDNTLLHSVKVAELAVNQEYLKEIAATREGLSSGGELFLNRKSITKVRPFAREFLREANTMFEMSIYTLGKMRYGQRMARVDRSGGGVLQRQGEITPRLHQERTQVPRRGVGLRVQCHYHRR